MAAEKIQPGQWDQMIEQVEDQDLREYLSLINPRDIDRVLAGIDIVIDEAESVLLSMDHI